MKKLARISSFDSKRSPVPERKEVSKQLDNLLGRTYQKLGNFLFHKKVFFTKLEKIVSVGSPVPEFIENICSVLEGADRHRKYSFIYRSMGNSANIAILRRQIEADKMEVLDDVKPTDDLTGLFKDFLLHLPSPTIPWDIAERIYALSKKQNYQLVEVKDLLNTVPYYHLKLLERIVIHFKRLLAFQKDNHLTEYSQSMLVSPCLTWPKVQKAENAVKDTDIQEYKNQNQKN